MTDESTALATRQKAGLMAMAEMTDDEFSQNLAKLKKGQDRIEQIKRDIMRPSVDFGVIPGTDKPTLLKPGAEKLCEFYGLRAEFEPTITYGDGTSAPAITVLMRCALHLGDLSGPVVAVGHGTVNSWEKKYRYRRGERACPKCGNIGSILRSKFPDRSGDKGWYCFNKKGGCGAQFVSSEPKIVTQQAGDVENPDPYELANTILKMAEKRAHVDVTLRATASSGLFTQDLDEEDQSEPVAVAQPAPKPEPKAAPKPRAVKPAASAPVSDESPAAPTPGEPEVLTRYGQLAREIEQVAPAEIGVALNRVMDAYQKQEITGEERAKLIAMGQARRPGTL